MCSSTGLIVKTQRIPAVQLLVISSVHADLDRHGLGASRTPFVHPAADSNAMTSAAMTSVRSGVECGPGLTPLLQGRGACVRVAQGPRNAND